MSDMTKPEGPISGRPTSPDLKARIVDFMERASELLDHEMASYRPPFMDGFVNADTGQVTITGINTNLLPKETLVYFAALVRPILFTESEPIYFPKLVAAVGQEHEALRPHTAQLADLWKSWSTRLFIGMQQWEVPEGQRIADGPRMVNAWMAPVGTPLPAGTDEAEMVQDFYYARVYLNGFVWHNDSLKTAEYRAADEQMQIHYRRCAEIRVFSGLQMVIKPLHQYFLDTRAIGEDF